MLQNMSSLVVLERVVRHSEKPVQRRPATVRERDSASTQGPFQECSAHPCQSWAVLREAGRKGGVLLPTTDLTAILSFSQVEGKNSCSGLKNKALLPQQHCVCFALVYSFSLVLGFLCLIVTFFSLSQYYSMESETTQDLSLALWNQGHMSGCWESSKGFGLQVQHNQ